MTSRPPVQWATPLSGPFAYTDHTLREVANTFAQHEVTSAPVVERTDPRVIVGEITLPQLLHARRRDLHEEHHREVVLAFRKRTAA
jgi:predicted transcriptional regulator